MNRNAGKAVVGGCIGCLLGGIVGALLGGGVGAYLDHLDHDAAARPQQGLLDFRLVALPAALVLASCGAVVGALIGSIGGAAYAVSKSEKLQTESAIGQPQPPEVASVDPDASADEELARLKKRVQELEDEQRKEAIQKKPTS
jgi:uncharacterized protein YcfJ